MSLHTSLLLALALTITGCENHLEDCSNGEDDDEDGFADCLDQDCYDRCTEDCSDGHDNDGDGLVDCLDDDCLGECPEDCSNGEDDDDDGFVDCLDQDCYTSCTEDCFDGYDNDGDGLADCWDDDCLGECPEDCDNGEDDDGDSAIDCADDDCDGGCPEVCDDTRDNDGDGATDCADLDCDGSTTGCPEVCDDGRDNDGDGLLDCEDSDCTTCSETVCDDGLDGDIDGLIDCADEDCWGNGCMVTIARLKGGNASVGRTSNGEYAFGWQTTTSGGTTYYGKVTSWVQLYAYGYSLYGDVVVYPATGPTTTCTWQIDTGVARLSNSFDYGVRHATTSWPNATPTWFRNRDHFRIKRYGFRASSGCPVQTSGFLPQRLLLVPTPLATIGGGLWYGGSTTGYTGGPSSWYESESTSSYAYYRRYLSGTAHWNIPTMDPSDPYALVHY
ncbi:MAG: hypothetical protein JRI25_09735 [Deltaproteobacteria bacterium]|nr:hypothetical protein [Deltaproteobacteria bacterium]